MIFIHHSKSGYRTGPSLPRPLPYPAAVNRVPSLRLSREDDPRPLVARRISSYARLGQYTLEERRNLLANCILQDQPPAIAHNWLRTQGAPNGSWEYVSKVIAEAVKHSPLADLPGLDTRWQHYPLKEHSLPGLDLKFSSQAPQILARRIAPIIKHIVAGRRLQVYEVGGLASKDSFAIEENWRKIGLSLDSYTGIDIHKGGVLVANAFNRWYTRNPQFKFILSNSSSFLRSQQTTSSLPKILLAFRFLSAIKPKEGVVFFQDVKQFLKDGDLLVFNYTIYNPEAEKTSKKAPFFIERQKIFSNFDDRSPQIEVGKLNPRNSMSSLREVGPVCSLYKQGIHLQTFWPDHVVRHLLGLHTLKVITPILQKRVGINDPGVNSQDDPYTRTLILSRKINFFVLHNQGF